MARFDGTRSEYGTEFLVTSFELDLTARVHFASAMAAFATGIDQPAPTAGMNLWGVFGVTIADLECEALGTLFVDAKMRRPVRLELLADVVQYSAAHQFEIVQQEVPQQPEASQGE